ncbi:TonB-dependent receptor [Geothrix oryzisoli]|uniref:TonB-dependent receptor n=1 Tax=Geothrix oryzisoli TaxID=2922721 RepID=UPI001FAC9240|nr:TonB-dependent receptor [Geothrix oryzisoli]
MLSPRSASYFISLLLIADPPLRGQTSTTGAITGLVCDTRGTPLAGARICATSPQIQRTTTSDQKGGFHLALLNPGNWILEFTLAGYTTLSLPLTVTTDNAHPVKVKLAPLGQARVEVVDTALQVDLSTNTQGSSLTAHDLERLPTGRDLSDLLMLGPGVEDSGFTGTGTTNWNGNPSVSGASSLENLYLLDGLVTNDFRTGFQGAALPKEWVDQVEVQTGGFAPEYSALGGVVVAVTKQGTNTFAGSLAYTSTLPQLQARPKYNPVVGQLRPNDPQRTWDTTFTVGGPLHENRLYYFLGGNFNRVEPDPASVSPNNQGLKSDPPKDETRNLYGKLNWFPHPDHQLTFVLQDRNRDQGQDNRYPTPNGTAQLGAAVHDRTRNLNLNWDWTISSTVLLAVKAGRSRFELNRTPTDGGEVRVWDRMYYSPLGPWDGSPLPLATLAGTAFQYGGLGTYTMKNTIATRQIRADLLWIWDSHALKAGFSRTLPEWIQQSRTTGGYTIDIYQFNSGPNQYQFRGLVRTFYTRDSRATGDYSALYIQDTWEVRPGFRLKYGLRYESQELRDSQGSTFFKFTRAKDVTQPRIGFTWDLKGDGHRKLSGSYGRYYEQIPLNPVMASGGGYSNYLESYSPAQSSYDLATRAWAITGPPDGIPGLQPLPINDYSAHWGTRPPIAEGIQLPRRDEYTLGYDHLFDGGWYAGVHFRWRKLTNVIEDSVPTDREGQPIDGEGFSILWNPKAGATVRWRNNALHSDPGALNVWVNDVFPTAYNLYRALDLTLAKHGPDYSLELSYTRSRFEGSYEGLAVQFQANANLSFTYDYWPYVGVGLLPLDHTHSLKLLATKSLPLFGHTFTVGTFSRLVSGIPSTDWDGTNDFGGYGPAHPIDGRYGNHGRLPTQVVCDLNLRYEMRFRRVKVTPSLDVFNLFNKLTVTGVDENKAWGNYPYPEGNPTWRQPWAWLTGRNLRWGLSLSF